MRVRTYTLGYARVHETCHFWPNNVIDIWKSFQVRNLVLAAKNGNLEEVREILEGGKVDVDSKYHWVRHSTSWSSGYKHAFMREISDFCHPNAMRIHFHNRCESETFANAHRNEITNISYPRGTAKVVK